MRMFMDQFNQSLVQKYRWYAEWHRNPEHATRHWIVLIVFALAAYGLLNYQINTAWDYSFSTSSASENKAKDSQPPRFASNQLLIKIKSSARSQVKEDGAANSAISTLVELDKIKKVRSLKLLSKNLGWYLITFNEPMQVISEFSVDTVTGVTTSEPLSNVLETSNSLRSAKTRLEHDPKVELVEYNYQVETQAVPNDPLWSSQWDMTKISAPAAWDSQTDASDIVVAVIDTGVDFNHSDLQANLWTAADGSHGFTCINGSCVPGGQDDHGHGTHVAGTIGAVGNNSLGVAGVNWRTKLLSIKFISASNGGLISDAVLGFQKLVDLKLAGVNIRVTNNSWGGSGYSAALKAAMAQLENLGVIDVAAAGNSNRNSDSLPMYPAAYDNRGIVSVLATDVSDIGASFTNYGLQNVDIAAPGVNIFSTAAGGSCSLCNTSGYRLLSGTSMASPHVAGVLAAVMHLNPALSAAQVRDLVLDPASYDVMSEQKAGWTSSGGRLNFFKTITNSFLSAPRALNTFPTITPGPNAAAGPGGSINLTFGVSDPDGDLLKKSMSRGLLATFDWGLVSSMLKTLIPAGGSDSISFIAPSVARAVVAPYLASAADGRGGGVSALSYATILPSSSSGFPPSGTLNVTSSGSTITIYFSATDPEGGPVHWGGWISGGSRLFSFCCVTGSSYTTTVNPGLYRVSVQAIDRELNVSRQTQVISIGGATGVPPLARATLDTTSGPAPFTVNVDTSSSTDSDGTVTGTFIYCDTVWGWPTHSGPKAACTYNTPGNYLITVNVNDNEGNLDTVDFYVTVTPTGTVISPLPPSSHLVLSPSTLSFSGVSGGSSPSSKTTTLSNTGSLTSNWSTMTDQGWCHVSPLSGTTGVGSSNNLSVSVDAPSNVGTFTCKVTISDPGADNSPQVVNVTYTVTAPVETILPVVSITSPLNGTTVARRSTVTIVATASDNIGVTRVEFYINNNLVCTDTTSAYTCIWKVSGAPNKTYTLQAKAYDAAGNVGSSPIITLNSK